MEDLLQHQLEQSFRLAMPEGLRDLMSDISREVLRAQPTDLYQFIAQYLEALLLARDTLCNACKVCGEICNCTCQPELDDELRNLGLDGEDLETAKNVILKHFDKGDVNEATLMSQLLKKTDIDINLLEDVQIAVRAAFLKHQQHVDAKAELTPEEPSPAKDAADKTLQIYGRVLSEEEQEKNDAAVKIQSALRGHSVHASLDENARKSKLSEVKLTFEGEEKPSPVGTIEVPMIMVDPGTPRESTSKPNVAGHYGRLSSTSLAGSFVHLPKHVPYSVHDITYVDFESNETERKIIYYHHDHDKKKIIFHDTHVLHEINDVNDDEENVEEQIAEEIRSDSSSGNESDENIEDIVHNVTYDDSDENTENNAEQLAFTEHIVKDSISNLHKKDNIVKESISSLQKKVKDMKNTLTVDVIEELSIMESEQDLDESEYRATGFHDKTIDDDIDSDDESMLRVEEEKRKKYAKADEELMKTLKEKLMKLSSSDMLNEK